MTDRDPDADVVARLPRSLRAELKEPLGPVYTDAEALLADAGAPLLAVGDVVTAHLLEAGRPPDVAVLDWRTEREDVDESVARTLDVLAVDAHVANPAGTLTADLASALGAAVRAAARESDAPFVVAVDGEEDLATLPAVVVAPDGASVVYGQPGEGMVLATVTPGLRERVVDLLGRFEGGTRLLARLS